MKTIYVTHTKQADGAEDGAIYHTYIRRTMMTFRKPDMSIWLPNGTNPSAGGNPTNSTPGQEQCCLNGECSSSKSSIVWKGIIKKMGRGFDGGGTLEECIQRFPTCEDMTARSITGEGAESVVIQISVLDNGKWYSIYPSNIVKITGDPKMEGNEYTCEFIEYGSGDCKYFGKFTTTVRSSHVHTEATYPPSEYCPNDNVTTFISLDVDLDIMYNYCNLYEHHASTYCGVKEWFFQKIQEYNM